jgi:hypothetical protein
VELGGGCNVVYADYVTLIAGIGKVEFRHCPSKANSVVHIWLVFVLIQKRVSMTPPTITLRKCVHDVNNVLSEGTAHASLTKHNGLATSFVRPLIHLFTLQVLHLQPYLYFLRPQMNALLKFILS